MKKLWMTLQLFNEDGSVEDPWTYEVGSLGEDFFELDFPSAGMTLGVTIHRDKVDCTSKIVSLDAYREQKKREPKD